MPIIANEDEIADLRARLAGLRMLLHARRLRAEEDGEASGDLVQPVLAEIAAVKARLRALGAGVP